MKEHLFTFNFSLSLVQEPHAARKPRCGHSWTILLDKLIFVNLYFGDWLKINNYLTKLSKLKTKWLLEL